MIDLAGVPLSWRALVAEINGAPLLGTPGVRDFLAPCDAFNPGEPGQGNCSTDGHYLCDECTEIALHVLRRRRDQCEQCGARLERVRGAWGDKDACSARCTGSRS